MKQWVAMGLVALGAVSFCASASADEAAPVVVADASMQSVDIGIQLAMLMGDGSDKTKCSDYSTNKVNKAEGKVFASNESKQCEKECGHACREIRRCKKEGETDNKCPPPGYCYLCE